MIKAHRFPATSATLGRVVLFILAASAVFFVVERSTRSATAAAPAPALLGTWVLVGRPGEVGEIPAKGGTIAFRTGRQWAEVQVNPRTGLVEKTSGGTYRITGDVYEETVTYGTESVAEWVGKTYQWKVKVEGDTFTRIGVGNPWTHVWKRVE